MFDLGQKVLVITENGITVSATILARARGDNGPGAYKVALNDQGPEHRVEWHRAGEVFVPEQTEEEIKASWNTWMKE
jgi:hypothetical protein